MKKIILDADNAVVGRLGTYAAKQLLRGEEVVIVNSEKALISGNPDFTLEKIRILRKKGGSSTRGPIISKMPDFFLKRMIRGMLPWDKPRGKNVYRNLRCYTGNPENLKAEKLKMSVPNKFMTIQEIVKLI